MSSTLPTESYGMNLKRQGTWSGHDHRNEAASSQLVKRQKNDQTNDSNNSQPEHGQPLRLQKNDYTVAWICALPIEMAVARAMLDDVHEDLPVESNDNNTYILGHIGQHNIVIACLPAHQYGTTNAAIVANNLRWSFPCIRTGLMVGIGGGVPNSNKVDLRLGDVVVGNRVMPYDLGKVLENGEIQRTGFPMIPQTDLFTAVSKLRAIHESTPPSKIPSILQEMHQIHPGMTDYLSPGSLQDQLFLAKFRHSTSGDDCNSCDPSMLVPRAPRPDSHPKIHYGAIASGNQVMKDGVSRDNMAQELDIICFEMEAAGLMGVLPFLVIRGICDYSDSHKNEHWQKYAAATAAAYAKELLLMAIPVVMKDETTTSHGTTHTDSNSTQDRRKSLLASLRFEQIDSRQLTIKAAHKKTCKWLLDDPICLDWQGPQGLSQHCGFLWISGKPGAGKSTIMKFVYTHSKNKRIANSATASFFFNARGDYLEKSTVGMHRSLLLQLLESFPDLQHVVDNPAPSQNAHLDLEILRELFRNAILALGQRCFTCFIDALDECDEQQVQDMVEYFEELGQQVTTAGVGFRICFSSRHYPYIRIRYGLRLTLENQQGHEEDLKKYVHSCLKGDPGPLLDEIEAQILQKASGVFMWVVLVVDILNKEFKRGRIPAVRKRLQELPSQLSDLFKDILTRDRENMEDLLLCIQWILYAKRPLKPQEFYIAVWSGLSTEDLSDCDIGDITQDIINRFVTSSSKGLAEITKSKHQTVQFIHESVRDFLIKDNGLQQLWPGVAEDFDSFSHEKLKQCCHAYITSSILNRIIREKRLGELKLDAARQKAQDEIPFLEYATKHVLYHADVAANKILQDGFLSHFGIVNWIDLNNILERYRIRRYTPKATLLYVLADKGFSNLIKVWLRQDPRIVDRQWERYHYPLFAAVANGHEEITRTFLARGTTDSHRDDIDRCEYPIDINVQDLRGRTALSWAAEKGNEAIIRLLVDSKADVKLCDAGGRTPLYFALGKDCLVNITMLIEAGADFNEKYGDERMPQSLTSTPLSLASARGHKGIVQQLIQAGADIKAKDENGQTALLLAASHRDEGVIQLLIEAGADIEAKNYYGQTPLFKAVENGHSGVVDQLIRAGSDVNARDQDGQTPLSIATKYGRGGVAEQLIKADANIEARDQDGRTPLFLAVKHERLNIAELLIGAGANIEARDTKKESVWAILPHQGELHSRCRSQVGPIIESADVSGATPLLWAARSFWGKDVIHMLIKAGADINSTNEAGQSPLILAAISKCNENVRLLIRSGADITLTDKCGQTARSWAVMAGYQDIVEILDRGAILKYTGPFRLYDNAD